MKSILLIILIAVGVSLEARSEVSCPMPDSAPTLAAEKTLVAGQFAGTRPHPATSTQIAERTDFQLWLFESGDAQVQREDWKQGNPESRSTVALRGTWSIERGYVVVFYGGYCTTFEWVGASEVSTEGQALRSIQGLPSSAWLLGTVMKRVPPKD